MKVTFLSSYSVGLFWFTPDYSQIDDIRGERTIKQSDLLQPGRIDPIGLHAEHDMPRDYPRGRICLENGIFTIWVGEDCEIDPTSLVKNAFGLKEIDDSKFKLKKHYHWNTKS